MAEEIGVNGEISRGEIQEAIAKTMELRATHAALMQAKKNSPTHLGFLSPPSSHFSAHDYPVFTPSYEEEPLPASTHIRMASQSTSENWDENRKGRENQTEGEEDSSSRKGIPSRLVISDQHIYPMDDIKSVASSSKSNHIAFLQISPKGTEILKSKRRESLDNDFKSVSSCNKCKPATFMPLTDDSKNKSRGVILSWLFPRSKRRQKNERAESEEASQVLNDLDLGIASIETLKKELIEANQKKHAAVMEVSEMKSSFGELKNKLEYLESHCEELKKVLLSLSKEKEKEKPPVSEEVMVEGLLQIVSESRQSMKHFCKTLFSQIEEKNLNLLLKPYKLSSNSKNSKWGFYHLASIINQAFYEDFENCMFQKNGTPKSLDPQQERQQKFQSFLALRNLSWNEVLKKGTKYHSEDFSNFCDHKMKCIIATLNWTRPWPEPLLQTFFIAAKCVWLLHLIAFSVQPPAVILRVEENRPFDSHYMEDVLKDKQKIEEGVTRIKVLVMPGFYVYDRILKCKVLCRYKSTT